jgi:hypothetical protein
LLYRRIVEQVGTGSDYGARAQARINEGHNAPAAEPAPAAAAPTPSVAAPEPPKDMPHIDTTDLPGAR